MTPRRHWTDLPHAEVSLLEWEPSVEKAPPVLLLHGGGADSAELSWSDVGHGLAAAGHRVHAPDHPGFGRSPRAAWPLTQENLVRYVGELVDALGLQNYAIAGLSLGGGMALGHLLDQPGRARTAALLGCYGLMPRLADGPAGTMTHFATFVLQRTGLLDVMTRSYVRRPAAMERGLRELVRDPRARTPQLIEAVRREATESTGLEVFAQWQRDQVRWNRLRTQYTDRLASIETPIVLVHGDRDTGVPLARITAAAERLPQGELVIARGAGHWVQRDRPDVVLPALIDHFGRCPRASAADRRSTPPDA